MTDIPESNPITRRTAIAAAAALPLVPPAARFR